MVREAVARFLDEMPATRLPSGADAMRLLERIAMKGVKFPGSLIMLSKVMFTLEGIVGDIVGADTEMGFTIARRLFSIGSPIARNSVRPRRRGTGSTLQCSALLYPAGCECSGSRRC